MYFWFDSKKEAETVLFVSMLIEAALFIVGSGATLFACYSVITSEWALVVKIIGVALYAPATVLFAMMVITMIMRHDDIWNFMMSNIRWYGDYEEEAES